MDTQTERTDATGRSALYLAHPRRPAEGWLPLYTERAADGNRGVWRVTEAFKRALPLKLTLGELAALLMSRALMS